MLWTQSGHFEQKWLYWTNLGIYFLKITGLAFRKNPIILKGPDGLWTEGVLCNSEILSFIFMKLLISCWSFEFVIHSLAPEKGRWGQISFLHVIKSDKTNIPVSRGSLRCLGLWGIARGLQPQYVTYHMYPPCIIHPRISDIVPHQRYVIWSFPETLETRWHYTIIIHYFIHLPNLHCLWVRETCGKTWNISRPKSRGTWLVSCGQWSWWSKGLKRKKGISRCWLQREKLSCRLCIADALINYDEEEWLWRLIAID